jgi:hypothetical protein
MDNIAGFLVVATLTYVVIQALVGPITPGGRNKRRR